MSQGTRESVSVLSWNAFSVFPYGVRFHEKVEERDEFPHAGDDRNFGFLAQTFQALIEGFDSWVMADRNDGRHVEHTAYLAASPADKALARLLA